MPVSFNVRMLNMQLANSNFHLAYIVSLKTVDTIQNMPYTLCDWPSSYQGGYLNFSAYFMTNVLFEQKKINLWKKHHFVENRTEIIQHSLKIQHIYLLPKSVKWIKFK
jgi:hypothetical protein